MKNALITGGAGFIGSNLTKLLLEKGWKVTIIDDLSSGNLKNIEGLNVEFINGSILDQQLLNDVCKSKDCVFHMAASVGRQRSIDNPQKDSTVNLIGTINVLQAMVKNKVPKIVYSSSAAMFGELESDVIDENHPLNADTPYGVSKMAAEKMILAFANIFGFTAICLRYFNIYGENQRFDVYGNVIPIFAKNIFANEPIKIFGDGSQTRDFVNVKDVALANYTVAEMVNKSDVFNLGSGKSISILDLAKEMIKNADSKIDIVFLPQRAGDVKHCKADSSKIKKQLDFSAKVDLFDGLNKYMQWYKYNCLK